MDVHEIVARRRRSLLLTGPTAASPAAVVRRLLAVQSQDYGPAKWSLGERTVGLTDAGADAAFDRGHFLRTHVLRPTWHFVHPDDIRWLLELTAPRVQVFNRYHYRSHGLDERVRGRAVDLIVDELAGGTNRTRRHLAAVLDRAGLPSNGPALGLLLMNAELVGAVCSGPRQGKQHTYALLDDRARRGPLIDGDGALVELVLRFFASHGPATIKDLRWWSSVTMADIRRGVDLADDRLDRVEVDGLSYWFVPDQPPPPEVGPDARLLQAYDEYTVAYSDSRHLCDLAGRFATLGRRPGIPNALMMVDGQLSGHWRRRLAADHVEFEVHVYESLDEPTREALQVAADAQGEFLGLPATVVTRFL